MAYDGRINVDTIIENPGLLEGLKEFIERLKKELDITLFDVREITDNIYSRIEWLKQWKDSTGASYGQLADYIIGKMGNIGEKIKPVIAPALTGLSGALTGLGGALAGVKTALAGLIGILAGLLSLPAVLTIGLPVAAIVGTIALLVTAKIETEGTEDYDQILKLAEAQTTLVDATRASTEQRQAHIESLHQEAEASQSAADAVFALAEKDHLAADEKAVLQYAIDELNKKVAGLNLEYDEQEGKLHGNSEAVKELIAAQEELLLLEAYGENQAKALEGYLAISKEIKANDNERAGIMEKINQLHEEYELAQANEAPVPMFYEEDLVHWEAALVNLEKSTGELKAEQAVLNGEYEHWTAKLAEAEAAAQSHANAAKTAEAEVTQAIGTETQTRKNAMDEYLASLEEQAGAEEGVLQGKVATLEEHADALGGVFEGIDEGLAISMEGIGTTLEEGLGLALSAVEEKFDDPGWSQAASDVMDAMGLAIAENKAVETAASEQIKAARTVGQDEVRLQDFAQVGSSICEGIAVGIRNGASFVTGAIQNVIQEALAAARRAADSHSPARKFMPLGADIDAGVAVGLEKAGYTTDAAAHMIQEMRAAAYAQQGRMGAIYGGMAAYGTVNTGRGGDVNIENINVEGAPINADLDVRRVSRAMGEETAKQMRLRGVMAT